jgi:3-hydroxyisobutyrate dehydrogenase-like beta-hydroxyacid dehydrogenase
MEIGFIGLGAMGRPMAKNLLKAGYSLTVTDLVPAAVQALVDEGAKAAASNAEVAAASDVVITMLPGDKQVIQVLMDPDFAASLKPGTVLLDMTSCSPDSIVEVEKFYKDRGVLVADAPVSGNVEGATAGTLSIFAAGEESTLKIVWPLLEVMGKQLFSLGPCGTGKAFKNLNNLLSISNMVIMTEMLRIVKKYGYDTDKLYDMISASSGMSASFKNRFHRMVDGNFDNGFKLSLARKDYGNALAMGAGVPMPVCKVIYELLLANAEHDGEDMAVMCKLFEK